MKSREKIRRILQEWAEFDVPQGYERVFDWRLLDVDEVLTVIGARRTGKTWLCYQMIRRLRAKVPAANVIYINFEDERLAPMEGDELTVLWDMCREIFPVDEGRRVYLFVDEIQNVKGWSKWARRITEQNRNLKLVITGSSSRLLSKEIATELRGRTLSFRVFPLSFAEYVGARNASFDMGSVLYGKQRPLVRKLFNEYMQCGGFPAVIDSPLRGQLLREYYNVMFYCDLVERHRIENTRMLEDYLTLLIDQTGCSFSISRTGKKLRDIGYSFSKTTLSNFLRYAQDAFLVFAVNRYCFKVTEQMRAPKKMYAIDHGLVQAVRFAFQENAGRMLENIAFIELQRRDKQVYYHKLDRECDFLTVDGEKVTGAVQISLTMSGEKTRKREVSGLAEAMRRHGLRQGIILTEDEQEEIRIDEGIVSVLPLWYWLLNE